MVVPLAKEIGFMTDEKIPIAPKATPEMILLVSEELPGHVASFLQKERKRQSLTQQDISDRSGRVRSWVSAVENGKINDLTAFFIYAAAIGIDTFSVIALAEAALWQEHRMSQLAR